VNVAALVVAATRLAIERACYASVARAPGVFLSVCASLAPAMRGAPVAIIARLFYVFKVLQVGVFAAWCVVHGDGSLVPVPGRPLVVGLATAIVVIGHVLVLTTFYRLGRTGVFFGDRFGFEVARCRKFPFSLLSHPQYVGTILTIWGLFLALRFPNDDWYAVPVLETVYYAAGARLEPRQGARKTIEAT
jgi:methylene-fatty-acyl-phospholipid synthase